MADEQETEIVLDDPKPQVGVEGKKTPEQSKSAVITADEGVEDLKAQVAKAREDSARRQSEANRQIEEARRIAMEAQREVVTVRKDAVSTLVDSLTKDKEAAKRDYRLALDAGDHEKAADAQDRIAMAAAKLLRAEEGRTELEAQAKAVPVQQPVRPIDDPVDRMAQAAEQSGDRRSADWIRSHPDFARDPAKWKNVEKAHYAALGDGIEVGSDRYFDFVNDRLGLTQRREEPRETSRAPTAAPVSRSTTQAPGVTRPGTIRLTAKDVENAMATFGPLYPTESKDQILQRFAKQKQAGLAEGQITRADW